MRTSYLRAIAAMIAAVALAFEAAGALFCFWETGALVYRGERAAALPPPSALASKPRLHPYFGYIYPYSALVAEAHGPVYTNNLGFLQRERLTLPYLPKPGDFVVAVFGGSVATNVSVALNGGTPLRQALQHLPEMTSRHVVLINMAQGAFKQPSHVFALSFLLAMGQHVDLALLVDGYNEFELGAQNFAIGVDPVLPAVISMRPLAYEAAGIGSSDRFFELAYLISSTRAAQGRHVALAAKTRSGARYALERVLTLWDEKALAAELVDYRGLMLDPQNWDEQKKLLGMDMPARETDPTRQAAALFDLWLRCADLMREVAAANGIAYLHVVQPNQYFSGHRFSAQEKAIALAEPPPPGLIAGYRLLAERRGELAKRGIVSAVDMFDAVEGDVYADTCCHLNERGETMFAEFLAREWTRAAAAR